MSPPNIILNQFDDAVKYLGFAYRSIKMTFLSGVLTVYMDANW